MGRNDCTLAKQTETINKEAEKLLMDILRRQGASLLNDGHKFSAYLSNSGSIQPAAQTSISTRVSASDINEDKIPVELLVIRGFRTPLQWSAGNGQWSIVQELLKAGSRDSEAPAEDGGRKALQAPVESGDEGIVKLLLKVGADVNAAPAKYSGLTALQASARGSHESIVKLLLDLRADVNAAPSDYSGRTALQAAAEDGYGNIVGLILEAGANANAGIAYTGGRTALQAAVESHHEGIVKLLLAAKADVCCTRGKEWVNYLTSCGGGWPWGYCGAASRTQSRCQRSTGGCRINSLACSALP